MSASDNKGRRQFIRNISIATFTAGLFPSSILAKSQSTLQSLACEETTKDYYGVGPFYTENPPDISESKLAKDMEAGTRIVISGRVTNIDCTEMIAGATIDIWHADDSGAYDNSGYNLRGKLKTNSRGFYSFETIKPGKYLNGSQYRPSHIHFKITPTGKSTLVTQLYFKGDTSIEKDAAASIKSGSFDATHRIIELKEGTGGKLEGTWDIAVDGDGSTIGVQDLHLDKGIIYGASPNPFDSSIEIKYGVFNRAKVGILIFDIEGKEIARLEDQTLSPEKYVAVWEPDVKLPAGNYFIALKMNDIQVQYVKVLKV
ncbi:MAG: protocatechuate 3,4-dioxygenase beta subunit [bacterium]|jgi:protocatechuate 3,4-dioxygenase beta subunit